MVRGGSEQTRRRFLTASATIGISTAIAGCSDLTGQFADSGATSLSYGASRELTLREGDGRDPEYGDLAKPVTFQGSSDDAVSITMTAEFDTHLLLEGPNGDVVAENDDISYPSNTDSRIRTTLGEDGEYTVWCGSFSGEETGPFTLSIEQVSAGGGGEPEPTSDGSADAASIAYGTSRSLTLREGDGRDPEYGDLAKPMTFRGSSGDSVAITMTAEFDTHLVLEGPDGAVVAENDDIEFPSNTDSRIRTTLSADGEYTIWCGSFSGSSTGSFELSLERQ